MSTSSMGAVDISEEGENEATGWLCFRRDRTNFFAGRGFFFGGESFSIAAGASRSAIASCAVEAETDGFSTPRLTEADDGEGAR